MIEENYTYNFSRKNSAFICTLFCKKDYDKVAIFSSRKSESDAHYKAVRHTILLDKAS